MKAWIAWLFGIKTCPICGDWSTYWCNTFDWYGDGNDCTPAQFK